jgi:hypothetical protein
MATVDLLVGIGAEYKGKPAFKKADKDILGLNRAVKTLARTYLGLAGAQKAFAYASASVKAFAQDDKAARQLSQTVGNLGLAYEATNVEKFIQGLERTYHVNDDLLRPSFAKLIQVTQSYTKSKELLTTALNASAGAGVDLTTTVQDLSQAYVGNLRGLRKYNLGLTQAELATMSFQQIQDKLNQTFTGQAALAADTYAGKIEALAIASNNAKEIIGKGLVDAIGTAFGNGDIDKAASNIEAMAGFVAQIARSLGDVAKFSGFSILANVFGGLKNKRDTLATKDRKYDPMSGNMPDMSPAALKVIALRKKADADAAKRQKELAALAGKQTKAIKEQTALQKAKAVLDKANAVFNLDLIQNTAALQGKITEEEILRLKLQREILLGNSDAAAKLSQELLSVQLAAVMAATVDPFGQWSKSAMEAMKALKELRSGLATLGTPSVTSPEQLLAQDYAAALADAVDPQFSMLDGLAGYRDAFSRGSGTSNSYQNITISIDPTAAQYGIGVASVNNSANGNSNNYSTIQSFKGGTGF